MAKHAAREAGRPSGSASLQSVEQALLLLEALAERGELGVSELAAILGRSTSGAFRLLATLQQRGYVQQTSRNRKYRLGVKLFELSAAFTRSLSVREVARPLMEELVRTTGETAHLSIFDRGEAINIETVESTSPVQVRSHVGSRSAAYATSTGKILLAYQSAETIAAVIHAGLNPHTAATLTDPVLLRQELAAIRERGYAINRGGWREGILGVAAPVRDTTGGVVAALSLAAPMSRVGEARLEEFVRLVRTAATEVSTLLGWVPADLPRRTPAPSARGRR
jgi:DNA-binding IclR family transcriptional regulator